MHSFGAKNQHCVQQTYLKELSMTEMQTNMVLFQSKCAPYVHYVFYILLALLFDACLVH